MSFAIEKLVVYQKTVDFTDAICARTEAFLRRYGFLVDQLNRAALSIAANIAEGNGRFTKRDRRNFFGIARGSAQECVPLLELARRRELLADTVLATLSFLAPALRPPSRAVHTKQIQDFAFLPMV